MCLPEEPNDDSNHLVYRGIAVVGFGPQDDQDLVLTSIDLNIRQIEICNDKYTVPESEFQNYWEIEDSLPNKVLYIYTS